MSSATTVTNPNRASSTAASTHAIRQVATFRLDREWFGIDVLKVREVLTPLRRTAVPQAPPSILGLINVRGVIMTQISLKRRLGFAETAYGDDHLHIVVEAGEAPVSVVVDEIGDVFDVDELPLAERPPTLPEAVRDLVVGVLRMDRRLITLLDVVRLVAP